MKFALTIVKNNKGDFDVDKTAICNMVTSLRNNGYSFSNIGWEYQPKPPHLLHIHTLLTGPKEPYFKRGVYAEVKTENSLHIYCVPLAWEQDVTRWQEYCCKQDSLLT